MTVGTQVLYYDTRLGGVPELIFGDPRKAIMRVPDKILKSSTFLCVHTGDKYQPIGSGFFVSIPSESVPDSLYTYLVTAKHCVTEGQNRFGDLYIRVNGRDGTLKAIHLGAPWIFATDPAVDLAVMPIGLRFDVVDALFIEHTMIATDKTLEEHGVGIGDDVVVMGLFTRRYGTTKNIPIIRVGNIAAMPDEPLSDSLTGPYHAYLLEARSIGGLSGSPVFVDLPATRPRKDNTLFFGARYLFLIGVIRGHWDHEEEKLETQVDFAKELEQVNMGIATATPSQELYKILFGDELVNGRKANDAERLKRMDATLDSAIPDGQQTPTGFTIPVPRKDEIESALKKASRKLPADK